MHHEMWRVKPNSSTGNAVNQLEAPFFFSKTHRMSKRSRRAIFEMKSFSHLHFQLRFSRPIWPQGSRMSMQDSVPEFDQREV